MTRSETRLLSLHDMTDASVVAGGLNVGADLPLGPAVAADLPLGPAVAADLPVGPLVAADVIVNGPSIGADVIEPQIGADVIEPGAA